MRRTRSTGVASLLAAAAVVLGPSATALAAPPPNDDYTGATVLSDLTALNADTSEATDASGEPLTEGGNGTCGPSTKLGQTVWYKVRRSSAGPISINTFGSSFDTVIAVYDTDGTATPGNGPPTISNAFLCSNDAADFSFGASRMTFTAQANTDYLVQAGGLSDGVNAESGGLRIVRADSPPGGDDRASPQDVTAGEPLDWDNFGGTEESGEDLSCASPTERPFGSTVWFHYVAPSTGRATFNSTGLDTVMQVYRGSSTAALDCNDDGPNQVGPSRVSLNVTPGDYFIQVGGYGGVQGNFSMSVEFTENLDVDGDGSNRPADCNDNNAGIHPGATDVPDNGVDEDCSGADAVNLDRDGDGFNRPQDCNDAAPGIHPGAHDVPGNGVDEDCSGSDAVNLDRDGDGIPRPRDCNDNNRAIHPGAHDIPGDHIDQDCSGKDAHFIALKWRYGFFFTPAGKVTTLTVDVPRGTHVRFRCRGGGCPGGRSLKSKGKRLRLNKLFHRPVADGATIELRAWHAGFIGRFVRITFHKGKPPTKRELCLTPRKNKPTKCG